MAFDWDTIVEIQEFKDEHQRLAKYLSRAIGLSYLIGADDPLVQIVSYLMAIQRYTIKRITDQVDLDDSEYLELLQKEVGFNIPLTDSFPLVEFLRESKQWNAHKGTEVLYNFIAGLVGSPIEIQYPIDHVVRTGFKATKLSGSKSNKGKLPWKETKRGFFHDRMYWTQFVYVVSVEQAQNIPSLEDFYRLLEHIHPAGTKRYVFVNFNSIMDEDPPETTVYLQEHRTIDSRIMVQSYPTLDNNWFLSSRRPRLSMHGGEHWTSHHEIIEVPLLSILNSYRQIWADDTNHMHKSIPGMPHTAFSRKVYNGDGTYVTLYADDDELLMNAQTTNMGLKDYLYEDLADLTYEELKNVAWDEDQKNMNDGVWFSDLLEVEVTEM